MREAREYATLVLLRRDRRWMAFLPLLAFGGAGSDTGHGKLAVNAPPPAAQVLASTYVRES